MQLHAVKSGGHGILGRLGVVGNDLANFRQRQFARRFIFLHALRGEMLRAFDFDGRRCHGQLAAAIHGMAHAASVPELGKNDSAFFMHGLRDFAPGGNLFFFKQARRERAAQCVGGNIDGFRQNQARAGALGIILRRHGANHTVNISAAARHGGHDHAVFQHQ